MIGEMYSSDEDEDDEFEDEADAGGALSENSPGKNASVLNIEADASKCRSCGYLFF